MKQRKIGMLKVGVVLLLVLWGANLAGAAGIGFGFEGSKTYLIQNTGVTLLSSVHQYDVVFGAGNGVAYGRAGNILCKIDSSGVSLVGPSVWGGITQYAGAGNGKAYVMVGNVVFLINGTNYAQVPTTWTSAARLVGAGNGTAFILEGNGVLWKLSGTTYSPCPSSWAGTTTFFSPGKEEALLKQGPNVYRVRSSGYWSHGSFNDATQYASGGIGVGYAVENSGLYRLPASAGGYQPLGTWNPTWMVGLGNGGLYLIDQNAHLFFMGATATTAQQLPSSWNPTLFEGLGDGDAVCLQNGSLFYLTGVSYAGIGSGTYNFTEIVGAMDIDSGTVAAYTPSEVSFDVPAGSTIVIDGTISEWSMASEWSEPFVWWNGTGLTSTTRAKFAYNDARDMLYVAIETDEASIRPGGHAVVGFGTSLNQTAYLGDGATQLAFQTLAGGNSVKIVNEIHEYKITIYPEYTAHYVDSGIEGVQAAYSYNGSQWTYEIAIPMWTNWAIGQMTTKTNLLPENKIYAYVMMQDELASANGTNMSYYGNPSFSNPGGLNYAAKLTPMPRAACNGPMLVDPVVYYSFDDIANIGKDSSGHGYDATVTQYPVTDSSNMITGADKGYFGGAANFPMPATNPDYSYTYHNALVLPAINAADIPTSGFSVAAWVHLDSSSIGEHYQLFAAEAGDGNQVVSAYIRGPGPNAQDNVYRLIVTGAGGTQIKDLYLGPITQDQWVHYVGTYDQATNRVSIYINGQLLVSALADTANLMLADNWNNGAKIGTTMTWGRQFVGRMDEFYLFNRALAPVEVKILSSAEVTPGDANGDGMVDVGDLGILAANYGGSGKTWPLGDFNKDGFVDVGDLGILAANYGSSNFSSDYAQAFGTAAGDSDEEVADSNSLCSALGLPLMIGLALMGLMLVKLKD